MIYPLPYLSLSEGAWSIEYWFRRVILWNQDRFLPLKVIFPFSPLPPFFRLLQKQVWNWQEAVWTENKRIILMNCHTATFIMSRLTTKIRSAGSFENSRIINKRNVIYCSSSFPHILEENYSAWSTLVIVARGKESEMELDIAVSIWFVDTVSTVTTEQKWGWQKTDRIRQR